MLQKVNRLLTILMLSLIGVFLGYSIYTCAACTNCIPRRGTRSS